MVAALFLAAKIGLRATFRMVCSNERADGDRVQGRDLPVRPVQLFYSKNIGESNVSCYASPAFDKLYERSRVVPDSPERNKLYVEMSRLLEADTVFVLQASPARMTVVQPWLLGYKAHPIMNTIGPYLDIDLKRQQQR